MISLMTQNRATIIRKNAPQSFWSDMYFHLVSLPWTKLLGLGFGTYLGVNLFFACVYFLLNEGLNPQGLGFLDCFFFSVQTFSTVGYGVISPNSAAVHFITMIEIFVGMMSMALTTGLIFSKFSKPSARFIFSDKLLLTMSDTKPSLVFRVANARSNQVMDANIALHVLYDEINPEGVRYRRFKPLILAKSHTPIFALSWTVVHHQDPESQGLIDRLLRGENIEFVATINGVDETLGQNIHFSKMYRGGDIAQNRQFRDILSIDDEGRRVIDFHHFNELL